MSSRFGDINVMDDDRLDDLSHRIAGVEFKVLGPEQRAKVIDLALKHSMAEDLYEIRRWFEESKLYEGQ